MSSDFLAHAEAMAAEMGINIDDDTALRSSPAATPWLVYDPAAETGAGDVPGDAVHATSEEARKMAKEFAEANHRTFEVYKLDSYFEPAGVRLVEVE